MLTDAHTALIERLRTARQWVESAPFPLTSVRTLITRDVPTLLDELAHLQEQAGDHAAETVGLRGLLAEQRAMLTEWKLTVVCADCGPIPAADVYLLAGSSPHGDECCQRCGSGDLTIAERDITADLAELARLREVAKYEDVLADHLGGRHGRLPAAYPDCVMCQRDRARRQAEGLGRRLLMRWDELETARARLDGYRQREAERLTASLEATLDIHGRTFTAADVEQLLVDLGTAQAAAERAKRNSTLDKDLCRVCGCPRDCSCGHHTGQHAEPKAGPA